MPRSLPSRLPPWMRGWHVFVLLLAVLTLANTMYLLGVRLAEFVAPPLAGTGAAVSAYFQAMLLGHSALGSLLVVAALSFSALHLNRVWPRRSGRSIATGLGTIGLGLTLFATGAWIIGRGAGSEGGAVWWLHVAAAAGLPVLYAWHRSSSVVRPTSDVRRRFSRGLAAALILLVVGHVATTNATARRGSAAAAGPAVLSEGPDPSLAPADEAAALRAYGFVPPGYVDPSSPFFPSPARTRGRGVVDGAAVLGDGAPSAADVAGDIAARGVFYGPGIGAETCVRCHPDVTRQWEASAHRFSSFNNPFYEASIERLRARPPTDNPWLAVHGERAGSRPPDGVVQSRWCAGCHDPALLFAGRLDSLDRGSPAAQAGLTCLACHAIERLHDRTGNGGYGIRGERPPSYLFSGAESGWRLDVHDALLRARPQAHKSEMLPDVQRSPELCMTCHKVSLRQPVNGYRWLRGQNEFDAWEDSGVSLEGIQSFYLPSSRRDCVACHMPLERAELGDLAAERDSVRSHRFVAANTALPYIRGDADALERVERYLGAELLTVDVFAFRLPGTERESLAIGNLIVARAGSEIELDVLTRNRGVGHAFPGGTIDSNEAWLDVRLIDAEGRVVARSGGLDERGHLDPRAHVFGALFVDSAGDPVAHRNAQDIRALVYRNVVGPGSARAAHFRLRVPEQPGTYSVDVRLRWRKFNRPYTEFVFRTVPEAFPGRDRAPLLPVTTIASARVRLRVTGPTDAPPEPPAGDRLEEPAPPSPPTSWERWNDFGIASLAEGDTRSAREAFGFVESLAPDRLDGPLNLARVLLEEGDLPGAEEALGRAAGRSADDVRIPWLRGEIALADGRYTQADSAFAAVLERQPRHRRSLLGLGRVRYQQGDYEGAVDALDTLLAIDPESLPAAYHRMLALDALGRPEAAEAAALVEYLRPDETAGRLVRRIRAERPGVNAMSQPVRTHRLEGPRGE